MRLKKGQKVALLQWIAEGLETDEINQRAAKYKPPFKVTRPQVAFYRKSRSVDLQDVKEAAEFDALKSGLAIKDERVKVLQRLANKLLEDLLPASNIKNAVSKLWLKNKKSVGFVAYEYEVYNKAEVDSLREILDDIAAEVGERVKKIEGTGDKGEFILKVVRESKPTQNDQ